MIGKPHLTARYERWRLQSPSKFRSGSFRTVDVGRKGFSKIVIGQFKQSGKWKAQSFLIGRREPKTKKMELRLYLKKILDKQRRM